MRNVPKRFRGGKLVLDPGSTDQGVMYFGADRVMFGWCNGHLSIMERPREHGPGKYRVSWRQTFKRGAVFRPIGPAPTAEAAEALALITVHGLRRARAQENTLRPAPWCMNAFPNAFSYSGPNWASPALAFNQLTRDFPERRWARLEVYLRDEGVDLGGLQRHRSADGIPGWRPTALGSATNLGLLLWLCQCDPRQDHWPAVTLQVLHYLKEFHPPIFHAFMFMVKKGAQRAPYV